MQRFFLAQNILCFQQYLSTINKMNRHTGHSWFRSLFGFEEINYKIAKNGFRLSDNGQLLVSLANLESFQIGKFSTPTLKELQTEGRRLLNEQAFPAVKDVKIYNHIAAGDAFGMHYEFPNAVIQAASQFNCLEFPSAKMSPEHGVTTYEYDNTQGPACAMACGAGTVYRNYFAPVVTKSATSGEEVVQIGQTKDAQINNLDLLEEFLNNTENDYWYVDNGYTFSRDSTHLDKLNEFISTNFNTPLLRNELLSKIKIGLHSNVGVNFAKRYTPLKESEDVRVTQVYCSALSCAYSGIHNQHWAPLARIILDAAYEATLWAALISSLEEKPHVTIKDTTTIDTQLTELSVSSDGENVAPDSATTSPHTTDYCKDVFLTFLGGGVFGNDNEWIASAIGRALAIMAHHKVDLNVHICHFRRVDEVMAKMIDESYDMYLAELSAGNEV